MRNFLFGILITIVVVLVFKQCTYKPKVTVVSQSELIQEQIRNVGKLVVTEGHFSEVFTYEDSKELFGSYLTAEKKALVVVKTDVTISYDLSQLKYHIDSDKKVLKITSIPNEEIKVIPEFEYYDIQADFFNSFEAEDYNNIKEEVKAKTIQRIDDSKLKSNAENRLISELSKFYILTQSMGWTLEYRTTAIDGENDFEKLLL